MLPWQNLRFWKDRTTLDYILSEDALIIPGKGILRACAISLPDLWRSRCCLSKIEGFDHSGVNAILGACGHLPELEEGPCLPFFVWQCGEFDTESEAIVSRLSIPNTCFDLQYVRPDFIMLRVIARNLIMWSRVHPSKDWVWSQIPEIVRFHVERLGGDAYDIDDLDAEAFMQAYVNIVAGACISLGLVFAGTRNENAQELLYEFAIYFLNEIKPVSPTSGKVFPKGLSRYIDRGINLTEKCPCQLDMVSHHRISPTPSSFVLVGCNCFSVTRKNRQLHKELLWNTHLKKLIWGMSQHDIEGLQ